MAMKISGSVFLLILSLLSVSTSARPCKTLFYFSTTTTTYYPLNPSNPNSLNSINYPQIPHHNPRYFNLIFTGSSHFNDISQTTDEEDSRSSSSSSSGFPHNWYSSAITKDIMSVVGALLFGVGCGAMTAGIMYFIWALFSPRNLDFDDVDSSSDDDEDDDDDIAAIKRKLGYVAVPVSEVADDINKTAPPAKDMI